MLDDNARGCPLFTPVLPVLGAGPCAVSRATEVPNRTVRLSAGTLSAFGPASFSQTLLTSMDLVLPCLTVVP